jgi:hypothetical protein
LVDDRTYWRRSAAAMIARMRIVAVGAAALLIIGSSAGACRGQKH